jgi:hypothetical protein
LRFEVFGWRLAVCGLKITWELSWLLPIPLLLLMALLLLLLLATATALDISVLLACTPKLMEASACIMLHVFTIDDNVTYFYS